MPLFKQTGEIFKVLFKWGILCAKNVMEHKLFMNIITFFFRWFNKNLGNFRNWIVAGYLKIWYAFYMNEDCTKFGGNNYEKESTNSIFFGHFNKRIYGIDFLCRLDP